MNLSGIESVSTLADDIQAALPSIIATIKSKKSRSPKNIFLLDQYGYQQVPFSHIAQIFKAFPYNSEVILTFATDALINHLSHNDNFKKSLKKMGLLALLDVHGEDDDIKSAQQRFLIEQCLYEEIQTQCGAKFYTPFFIRSRKSNRAYWLIHLSGHATARNEMLNTHWENYNKVIHHGLPGLNMMLGAEASLIKAKNQQTFDFGFDSSANLMTTNALMNEIPSYLPANESITVGELFEKTCNRSPAKLEQYQEALYGLQSTDRSIHIHTPKGNPRQSVTSIELTDTIHWNRQIQLLI